MAGARLARLRAPRGARGGARGAAAGASAELRGSRARRVRARHCARSGHDRLARLVGRGPARGRGRDSRGGRPARRARRGWPSRACARRATTRSRRRRWASACSTTWRWPPATRSTAHGLARVFVLDWDVHHGNGTNDIFHATNAVLFASLHQSPLYPGTGPLADVGAGEGEGFTINLPVPPGSGEDQWLALVEHIVIPAARAFEPQLVLVSAGFDAHRRDPLASCLLETSSFAELRAPRPRARRRPGRAGRRRARGRLQPGGAGRLGGRHAGGARRRRRRRPALGRARRARGRGGVHRGRLLEPVAQAAVEGALGWPLPTRAGGSCCGAAPAPSLGFPAGSPFSAVSQAAH